MQIFNQYLKYREINHSAVEAPDTLYNSKQDFTIGFVAVKSKSMSCSPPWSDNVG